MKWVVAIVATVPGVTHAEIATTVCSSFLVVSLKKYYQIRNDPAEVLGRIVNDYETEFTRKTSGATFCSVDNAII